MAEKAQIALNRMIEVKAATDLVQISDRGR